MFSSKVNHLRCQVAVTDISILSQTNKPVRFWCSHLHLSRHVVDTQAELHTQAKAAVTSDWQVCREITNQKHLASLFIHIFPHNLRPPGETYIYLFITVTRSPPSPPIKLWKLFESWKHASALQAREHMAGAIVGIICVIFFGHIRFGSRASSGNS